MEKYDHMSNNQPPPVVMHQCAVCNNEKIVKVEVILDNKLHKLCSEPCFAAFKFVNKVNAGKYSICLLTQCSTPGTNIRAIHFFHFEVLFSLRIKYEIVVGRAT
jgi:hypothetical protein